MIKKVFLFSVIVAEIVFIWSRGQIIQNLDYHNFADTRLMMGVPNFFDVISNLPFFLVGAWGGYQVVKNYTKIPNALSWFVFFAGVFLVAPGSMYYHLNPMNATLVWDRLPMTIAFMGLTVALLSFYFPNKLEKVFLPIALALGFGSIGYWVQFDDLRLYFLVQLTPILMIPILALMYKSELIKKRFLFGAFGFYLLAKLTETFDTQVFEVFPLSGHTIKHLLAAAAVICFIRLNRALYR